MSRRLEAAPPPRGTCAVGSPATGGQRVPTGRGRRPRPCTGMLRPGARGGVAADDLAQRQRRGPDRLDHGGGRGVEALVALDGCAAQGGPATATRATAGTNEHRTRRLPVRRPTVLCLGVLPSPSGGPTVRDREPTPAREQPAAADRPAHEGRRPGLERQRSGQRLVPARTAVAPVRSADGPRGHVPCPRVPAPPQQDSATDRPWRRADHRLPACAAPAGARVGGAQRAGAPHGLAVTCATRGVLEQVDRTERRHRGIAVAVSRPVGHGSRGQRRAGAGWHTAHSDRPAQPEHGEALPELSTSTIPRPWHTQQARLSRQPAHVDVLLVPVCVIVSASRRLQVAHLASAQVGTVLSAGRAGCWRRGTARERRL